ncbi:MAG: glycerophosphoryl diester phosphodiesterase [Rhodospirillales bacterium]|nr:glycerophosphoryl diester phosphodiesterase [Rhodospirillales bacterium]
MAPRWPKVIGHRGAARHAPENTLASFRRAAELGTSWVELDARLTADGVPIVFHDSTLERTTGQKGRVRERRWAEIAKLDAGGWFAPSFQGEAVPSLSEALALIASLRLGVNIEIKPDPGDEAETARVVMATARQIWLDGATAPLISSFSQAALVAAQPLRGDWPLARLARNLDLAALVDAKALECAALNLGAADLTQKAVATAKDAGFGVLVYTVNDRPTAERFFRWGVDGVFTDDPEVLI